MNASSTVVATAAPDVTAAVALHEHVVPSERVDPA